MSYYPPLPPRQPQQQQQYTTTMNEEMLTNDPSNSSITVCSLNSWGNLDCMEASVHRSMPELNSRLYKSDGILNYSCHGVRLEEENPSSSKKKQNHVYDENATPNERVPMQLEPPQEKESSSSNKKKGDVSQQVQKLKDALEQQQKDALAQQQKQVHQQQQLQEEEQSIQPTPSPKTTKQDYEYKDDSFSSLGLSSWAGIDLDTPAKEDPSKEYLNETAVVRKKKQEGRSAPQLPRTPPRTAAASPDDAELKTAAIIRRIPRPASVKSRESSWGNAEVFATIQDEQKQKKERRHTVAVPTTVTLPSNEQRQSPIKTAREKARRKSAPSMAAMNSPRKAPGKSKSGGALNGMPRIVRPKQVLATIVRPKADNQKSNTTTTRRHSMENSGKPRSSLLGHRKLKTRLSLPSNPRRVLVN